MLKSNKLLEVDNYTIEYILINDKALIEKELEEIILNKKDSEKFYALLKFIVYSLNENNPIPKIKFRSVGKGIYEIKFHSLVKQKEYRFFNFFFQDKRIIITNSYVKKTNKTDRKQIEKAIRLKQRFEKES